MKQQQNFILYLLLVVISFSSCSKDNETEPTDLLVSRSWKPALVDKNTTTNPPGQIIYFPVASCQQDDTYQFNANGKLTIKQGANKCDNSEPAERTVDYTYDKDSQALTIDGFEYVVAEVSASQFKYYRAIPTSAGFQYLVYLLE